MYGAAAKGNRQEEANLRISQRRQDLNLRLAESFGAGTQLNSGVEASGGALFVLRVMEEIARVFSSPNAAASPCYFIRRTTLIPSEVCPGARCAEGQASLREARFKS